MGNAQKKSGKCLVVGLDNSGKSTIINHLKPDKKKATELYATVGFLVEKFKYNNVQFTMFDMSGQGRYRNLWEHYYAEAEGVIFVIDSADTVRMCVVKDELDTLLAHKDLSTRSNVPVLFFANKMDLPKAMTAEQISTALELHKLGTRPFTIVASNALTGGGLDEGVKWLSGRLP